jgi:CDP-diacylglycerol--glycerol-3-phosphate 3-phosphatidyltransferase
MPWMVTTILIRELIVQALRSLIEGRGEAFGARMLGKLKTVFQCLAIGGSLVVLAKAGRAD